MILLCPNCNTRYRVDDAALSDPAGRELRCANCDHRWRYEPEPAASPAETVPPAVAPSSVRPAPPVPPAPLVASASPASPSATTPAAARPPVQRGSRAGLGCLALIVVIAVAIAVGASARNRIVAWWPSAASVYRSVGLRLEPPGAGLEIGKVTPTRNGDTLLVEGDVTNSTDADRVVPRLRVILRDNAGKELTGKVIDPPATYLAGSATAHFKTQFEHPSDAATGVAVTFTR